MKRPEWDQYFLKIASVVATRSTCNRKQVGCVLVRDKQIISTGYGGSIRGQPHCTDVGCNIDPKTGGCIRTVHAEMNAVSQAARNGVSTENSTAYITLSPCYWCFKTLINAGVTRIIFAETYRVPPPYDEAKACGVQMGPGFTMEELSPASTRDLIAALERIQNLATDRERYVVQGPFMLGRIQQIVEAALACKQDEQA